MNNNSSVSKHRSLATLITRITILVLGVCLIGIFIQSYYFSKQIIIQEIFRTKQQTSTLIQNLFDFHLEAIQIQQRSNARNEVLSQFFYRGHKEELNRFFQSSDQSDPDHTPEFRFLTDFNQIVWDDGNAQFYGVDELLLKKIESMVSVGSDWHYVSLLTLMGNRHMLIRRVPVVENFTGEVLGQFYIVIVLDNNLTFLNQLRQGSNSDNVVLLFRNKAIASSLNGREPYSVRELLESQKLSSVENALDDILITRTPLKINRVTTPLTILSVQSNSNVASLQRKHYWGLAIAMIVLVLMAFIIRNWIHGRISRALESLMKYTQSARSKSEFVSQPFAGSDIEEFSHIGHTLEHTFEQLETQRQSFKDLFNFALSPMMVWADNGLLIQMNPAARKELVVERINSFDQMNPRFQMFKIKLMPHINMASKGATLTGVNVPIGDKVFRWTLSPIKVDGGISGIIVQGQDITTMIEAEKQSNLARLEAEKSAQARADFLAKMSHEIRTPLNGILGVSQLLKQDITDPKNVEQIEVLLNSGEHLLAVMNDILDFSKIEQGKFAIERALFPFSDVVNTLDNIYRPACKAKGVYLDIDNKLKDDVYLYSDQIRLNQILFNLVSNSVKFTASGAINVRFQLLTAQADNKDKLQIEVTDTGIGIDKDKLYAVFEPFVQEESTTTREFGGSGLGLTIVKSLVEMMDGHISVTSTKGEGTSFNVAIPVEHRQGKHHQLSQQSLADEKALFPQTIRVLMVEDNRTNAFILQAFCKKYAMDVSWAKDGVEALELVKNESFDLIFMDNQLPRLGGIEATQSMRQALKLDTPIYACTADNQQQTRDAFLAAGANYVLVKPIKEQVLYRALLHFKENYL